MPAAHGPAFSIQIKRCSGPCVGRIGGEDYAALVAEAREFLAGKSREVQQRLAVEMQTKSEALEFEAAARLRDRIRALAQIQSHQAINVAGLDEADVIAAHQAGGNVCIQVFFFRAGSNYGNRAYFPSHANDLELDQILAAFIGQFYDNKEPPKLILLSDRPAERGAVAGGARDEGGAFRSPGGAAARRQARSRPKRAAERARGARPPTCGKRLAAAAAGRRGRCLRAGGDARAHRGLRQQPHLRTQRLWRHDRRRARRLHQGRLPQVRDQQSRGAPSRATTTP